MDLSIPALIRLRGVGLDLPVYSHDQRGISATLGVIASAAFTPPKRTLRTLLDDISFEANDGDRFAIVGRNGAGKSTLLRTIVGAYPPTRGALEVVGKPRALLNLALGFNGEATLIENIMLRGIAMGMTPSKAYSVIEEVLGFAELAEKAGDRLKTLSSGQRMRLGFSLATVDNHEILVMDEWIGTGDAAFVRKARERIRSRVDSARIVVLASHNLKLLKEVCNRGVLLEKGRVLAAGEISDVIAEYHKLLGK